jgi:hypothetical protein
MSDRLRISANIPLFMPNLSKLRGLEEMALKLG